MFSIGANGATRTEVQTLIEQGDTRGDLTAGHKAALTAVLDALPEGDSYTATISGTADTFEIRVARSIDPVAA